MTVYLYAVIAGVILALGGIALYEHHAATKAHDDFIAYQAQVEQIQADAAKAAQIKQEAVEKANAAIIQTLNDQLAGSIADGTRLALELRRARTKAGSGPVPQAPGQPPATAPSGKPSGDIGLEAAAWAACERDGSRLDALIDELKPQL